jgi:hypothetical protein
MTETDRLRGPEIQTGIRTRESPRQPRRKAHEQDPPRPAVRGWPIFARVSPLAHMLIIQVRAESCRSSNNPRATPNCITYLCIPPPPHPTDATGIGHTLASCGGFDWLTGGACNGILTAVSAVS